MPGSSDSTSMDVVAGEISGTPEAERRPEGPSPEAWRAMFTQVASGDPAGLEALYRVAARRIFGLALWRTGSVEDAADVVQEVFVRLAESRDRLHRVADPRAWLLALAHHVAVDVARRRMRQPSASLDEVPHLVAPGPDGNPVDAARASRLLTQLPAAQRDAVYLRHYEECTFAAIGTITGVPTFTAASRYRLGIARLRRLLEVEP
jgi:RNA polymerase sigma-70 factor (ECF subfamily)